jgi:hypothetical protein
MLGITLPKIGMDAANPNWCKIAINPPNKAKNNV